MWMLLKHLTNISLCSVFVIYHSDCLWRDLKTLFLWCFQVQTDISVDSKHQTLQGVAFPLHRDAVAALERYKHKVINYVQLVSLQELIISELV